MLIKAHKDKFMKKENTNKAIVFGLRFFQFMNDLITVVISVCLGVAIGLVLARNYQIEPICDELGGVIISSQCVKVLIK